jgi:superkiller protein 3
MSPEQARGQTDRLDERTDVFGLGALLCEILTGQPPFAGTVIQALQRAQRADLADSFTRLNQCGADAELIRLARRCLAEQPADRFRHAGELTAALTAYLEGVETRLLQAELARASEQARAEQADARARAERRAGRLALALAGCVLALVGTGAGGYLWDQQRRVTQQRELTRRVDEVLDKVADLRQRSAWAEALAEARHAEELLDQGLADPALRQRVRAICDDLEAQVQRVREERDQEKKDRRLVDDLDAARLVQAEAAAGEARFAVERAIPQFRKAFRAYGLPVGVGDPAVAAARLRRRPLAVRQAVSAVVEEWLDLATENPDRVREPHRDWLRALAAEVGGGGIPELRAACQERDLNRRRAALERLAEAADARQWPPRALVHLARRLHAAVATATAVQLLRRAWRQHPADFWVNEELGLLVDATQPQNWAEAVSHLTAAVALRPDCPGAHLNLGIALAVGGQMDESIACSQKAIALDPNLAGAHLNLGLALSRKGEVDEAIECYRKAIALDPKLAGAHNNLGTALLDKGEVDEAIACLRQAVALAPGLASVHNNLGNALALKGEVDEAIECYQKAIALDPKHAAAHYNLGAALVRKGPGVDKAIVCFRKAIALDPKHAGAHHNLGNALLNKGKVDEAVACYQKAIALDPKDAKAHNNLGNALALKGEVDESIACYQKSIALDPKLAGAHNNLGAALVRKGPGVAKAIASFRKAIALDPKDPQAHNNLGFALDTVGKPKEAIEAWRMAVRLEPRLAMTHFWLGKALLLQGRPSEALVPLDEAAKRLPAVQAQALGLSAERSRAECMARLEKRLPDLLAGKDRLGDNRERLDLGELCRRQHRFAASARFFTEVFAAEAKLADDLTAAYRYNAACSAALAAAGQGEDAGKLDDKERTRLRQQALDWLRADLAGYTKRLEGSTRVIRRMVQQRMRHWQKDTDLTCIRDKTPLAKLPAQEQKAFAQLWADVAALLAKTAGDPK